MLYIRYVKFTNIIKYMTKTVGDILVDTLIKNKIDTIFGIIGAGNAEIFSAIKKRNEINLICLHHEQSLLMAMQNYYKVSKKLSVALVTTGGGTSNTFTGLVGAWMDSVPGIIISGNEKSTFTKKNNKLRVWGVQGFDGINTYKNFCKIAERLINPNEVITLTNKVIRSTLDGRPGPSWLEIPLNVQNQIVDYNKLKFPNKNKKEKNILNNMVVSRILNEKISKLINEKKRPLIIFGNGCRNINIIKLKKLINKFKFPFLLTWSSADLITHENKYFFGKSGVYGERSANFIVQNSDLIITIGTRLSLLQIGYELQKFAPKAKIIMVDIDKKETNKFKSKRFLKINVDAEIFVNNLISNKFKFKKKQPNDWLKYCNKTKKEFPKIIKEHKLDKKLINSYVFVDKINSIIKKNEIVVTDMGTALLTTFYALKIKNKIRLMSSLGLGEMGFGLPGAIGASIASKKGSVLCMNGDGAMMFNLQELETIQYHNLPIKIIIFSNDGYLSLKHTQKDSKGGKYIAVDKKTGVSCPNFEKIGKSFGIKSISIKNWSEFKSKFKKFYYSSGPGICELFIPVNQPFIPRQSNQIDKKNNIYSLPIHKQTPFIDEQKIKEFML